MTDAEDAVPRSAWLSIASPDGGGTHMQVTLRDGRWVVSGVYMHGPEITAPDLQAVPVRHLEMVMNLTGLDPNTLSVVNRFGGMGYPILEEPAEEPSLADLRAQATDAPQELNLLQAVARRPWLTRPDGSDPDAFYEQVARAYREYAAQGHAPARDIANEAGVPVGTAHGWIREARRRGHLPPGRKGKAG
jgi:hypothetical protein